MENVHSRYTHSYIIIVHDTHVQFIKIAICMKCGQKFRAWKWYYCANCCKSYCDWGTCSWGCDYCFYAKVCNHVCIPRCVQYGSVLHIAQVWSVQPRAVCEHTAWHVMQVLCDVASHQRMVLCDVASHQRMVLCDITSHQRMVLCDVTWCHVAFANGSNSMVWSLWTHKQSYNTILVWRNCSRIPWSHHWIPARLCVKWRQLWRRCLFLSQQQL